MARIGGVDIPGKKNILNALTYIYGIGLSSSSIILEKLGIDPNKRTDEISDQVLAKMREEIENYKVEGDLRKEVSMNVKRLTDLGAYRGLRHKANLPVRGQRTHTNSRTRKGRPRIAIAGKKQAAAPK